MVKKYNNSQLYNREQVVMTDNLITTDSGLQYVTTAEGFGASPEPGQSVSVFYIGKLEDGTVFDSTFDESQGRNVPFTFDLGTGQVIQGWDLGIDTMEVGEARTLVIPPDLAYGSTGVQGVIPPDATLTFDVVLLQINTEDNVAPELVSLDIDKSSYEANQSLNLTTSVTDQNGFDDIALVDLYLIQSGTNSFAPVGGVTDFNQSADSETTGSSSYTLSLKGVTPGDYELQAYPFDQQGYSGQFLSQNFSVTNSAPSKLQFDLDQSDNTLKLTNAWIEEYNGNEDLASVDFWLQLPDGSWEDLDNATEFQAWTEGVEWSSFEYELDLSDYTTAGTYSVWGKGHDQSGAETNEVTKTFTIGNGQQANNQLIYRLNNQTYNSNSKLRLAEGWVFDSNNSSEIKSVDFWLKPSGADWQDLEDATSFNAWGDDNRWASFNYELDISGYPTGTHTLWGQAYTEDGARSNEIETQFRVEAAPSRLQGSVDQQVNDTLRLNSGWVYHADGSNQLSRVDVWLLPRGGEWQDLQDITNFQAWSEDSRWASFDYQLDMSGYQPNTYTLWTIAYDADGQTSLALQEDFQLV